MQNRRHCLCGMIFPIYKKFKSLTRIFFPKKLFGYFESKQYIFLTCAPSCDIFTSGTECCQTDNCNMINQEISMSSSSTGVSSCYIGGSFALTDTASGPDNGRSA